MMLLAAVKFNNNFGLFSPHLNTFNVQTRTTSARLNHSGCELLLFFSSQYLLVFLCTVKTSANSTVPEGGIHGENWSDGL